MSSMKITKREGSADANSPGNRRTARLPTEETNAIKQLANGFSRTSTIAHGPNVGDAVLGEDSLSLLAKLSRLEKDLERRKASYSSREDAYKNRVASLEEELSSQQKGGSQPKKTDSKLHELKAIQAEILESVELVQDRTARIMQEQERDLLRSFRARLFDVQTELEKEKSKKDDGLAAWRERYTQLEAELDWATEVSNRLDKVNQTLTDENNELKIKYASQEQDRNLFIELLVSLKKDNALWRSKNAEIIADNDRLKVDITDQLEVISGQAAAPLVGGSKGFQAAAHAAMQSQQQQRIESEEKFKDVNIRLRRLVAEERKQLQQLRQTYAQELKVRTEMEVLLRKCVDDVRQDIAEMHHEAAQFSHNTVGTDLARLYNSQPGSVPFDDFDPEEHKRNLELLLSQERVVSLIYAKTFPIAVRSGSAKGARPGKANPLRSVINTGGPATTANTNTGTAYSTAGPGSPLDMLNSSADAGEEEGASSRPHTANAIVGAWGNPSGSSVNGKSEKFPPIASAASRLASR